VTVQLIDPEDFAELAEQDSREVVVTVRLAAEGPGRLGPILDQLEALAKQSGFLRGFEVPGYHQTFYGHECDQDDG
jgi:hypothetical protein